VEASIPDAACDALRARGHRVVVQPASGAGGSAQIISRDDRGILSGAADPRQEGVAIGVD
jgi:gamma-glutamyltranspeptidase / glutathione hydrolase